MTMQATSIEAWSAWRRAAGDPIVDAALRGLYAQLDEAVQQRGPVCWVSGRCCRFDTYGHRLYVTGLEVAWVLHQVQTTTSLDALIHTYAPTSSAAAEPPDGCPFQVNTLCSVHAVRPLGCRVFFCQQGTEQWQQQLYERFLQQLQHLHEQHDIDYHYMEWRAGLGDALAAMATKGPATGAAAK